MSQNDFEIDVDLSQVLGSGHGPLLLSSRWYELVTPREDRSPRVQFELERAFRKALLQAQWRATARRMLDRRRAARVPLLSRVRVDAGQPLVACDISVSGLRCSGKPRAPVMDVEFRLPGLDFPVDARVEVVSWRDANVIPLVGLRFAHIDRAYLAHIAGYVARRQERVRRAA